MFNNLDDLKEYLTDFGYEETIILENPSYITAIIGISDEGQLIYDYEKMIEFLMDADEMNYEEAMEFVDYNTIRALPYMGYMKPIISHKIEY